ncbi:hypothetical protein [Micromonospora sp. NPDC005324]|uniref:hypothetical protein n=1 Tax=Micromonospora sp. NPDC005324 TaxID=3157033 RepID=UPI00339EF306
MLKTIARGVIVATAVVGTTFAAGASVASAAEPASASASANSVVETQGLYWRYGGTWSAFDCFNRGNWYLDSGNASDYRCDYVGNGRNELWLLVNDANA